MDQVIKVDVYDQPVPATWKMYMQLRAEYPTMPESEAARRVGVSAQTIYHWRRKPSFQRYETWYLERKFLALPLEVRRSAVQVREQIESYSGEMFDRLVGILESSEDDKLCASIAQDLLDRAGIVPVRKLEVTRTPMFMTPELAVMLNRRATEAGVSRPVAALEGEIVEPNGI